MTIGVAEMRAESLLVDGAGRAEYPGLPFSYHLYGLRVCSDFELPFAPALGVVGETPDLVFRRVKTERSVRPDGALIAELRCHGACHGGNVFTRVHRGPGGTWFWR